MCFNISGPHKELVSHNLYAIDKSQTRTEILSESVVGNFNCVDAPQTREEHSLLNLKEQAAPPVIYLPGRRRVRPSRRTSSLIAHGGHAAAGDLSGTPGATHGALRQFVFFDVVKSKRLIMVGAE